MPRSLLPSPLQYSLIAALFVLLLWGLLVPGGNARAGALAAPLAGTPVANGTPVVSRPAPSAPAAPPPASAPVPVTAPVTTPVTTPVRSSGAPVATPATSGIVGAATPALPRLPSTRLPTATPTRTPTGNVSAAVARDLSPLSFTLNGREQIAQTTLVVAVRDAAPATWQPGWTLSLSVAQFRVAGYTARALPDDAVTLLGVTVACAAGAECSLPENAVAYPLVMPAGVGVPIYAAVPGSGSGQFTITPTFAVKVPGNAFAGSYTTTIAVDIAR